MNEAQKELRESAATVKRGHRFKDITGNHFGRLTAIAPSNEKDRGVIKWECSCECGGRIVASGAFLRDGRTASCGCLERSHPNAKTHGATTSGTPTAEYNIYSGMKRRCLNPNEKAYPRYGGRGIKVCDRWLNSFENFLADVGPRPSPHHSIDRYPNNDGNYEPGNVRWATRIEQANNTSKNRHTIHEGEPITIGGLARKTGIPFNYLYHRIITKKWSAEKALRYAICS